MNKRNNRSEWLFFPRKKPATIRAFHKWHRKLLEDCVFFEFKKRVIEAALGQINREIQKYVGWLKDYPENSGARLALRQLNRLKEEWQEELQATKQVIRGLHKTNEAIIATLLRADGAKAYVQEVLSQEVRRGAHLLHEPGWLLEMASARHLEERGYAAFVAFGTVFDQLKVDVVGFASPNRRIKWLKLPPVKRWKKAAGIKKRGAKLV